MTQTAGAGPAIDDLVALIHCDLGSVVRARSLPSTDLSQGREVSAGWVPSAQGRSPLGPSADPNPFGATGDLRLLADLKTRAKISPSGEASALELVICDLVEPDGTPWDCCPRTFLRGALDELREELGAHLVASFEHEFQLLVDKAAPSPLSLAAQRSVDPFPMRVMAALAEAGLKPERFVAERSPYQFEIPLAPAEGMGGPDRSVVLRTVVQEVGRREGRRVTFVPMLDPAAQGNGLHINLSLRDLDGGFLFHDPARQACLSELGGRFAAGILAHASALSALTAPSAISSLRLRPGRRGAGSCCLGDRNRETLLRIPPLLGLTPEMDQAAQMRLEYRGADAAANPHLALGVLIRAGLQGVREELEPSEILERDPSELSTEEAVHFGVGALPTSLEDALQALAEDATVRGWLSPRLYELYVALKDAEIQAVSGQEPEEICRRYAAVY